MDEHPVLSALSDWNRGVGGECTHGGPSARPPPDPAHALALGDDDDDDGEEDQEDGDAWQQVQTWACEVCTFSDNFLSETHCTVCGAPGRHAAGGAPTPAVLVTWHCGACTLENSGDESLACSACGTPRPQKAKGTLCQPPANAWGVAPPARAPWTCGACGFENDGGSGACGVCGQPRVTGGCVACTPRKACRAHVAARLRGSPSAAEVRERARTEAWLAYEQQGWRPLYRDPEAEEAALNSVDARTRRATVASLPRVFATVPRAAPTAEEFRDMYSAPRPEPDTVKLDTDWENGREPRRRVQLLVAAGWRRVPTNGGHPKWRRELPHGAPAQVVTFASTPSTHRAYDYDKTALHRLDREATAMIARAKAAAVAGGAC